MISKSKEETQKIAKNLARRIARESHTRKEAFVIALRGDLGGGKTTFLQGLAKGLGIKKRVLSPTFNIFRKYDNFYHFDCYRIEKSEEISSLGFEKIISNPKNIVAIEWAEKIEDILPKDAIWIKFSFVDEDSRSIDFLR